MTDTAKIGKLNDAFRQTFPWRARHAHMRRQIPSKHYAPQDYRSRRGLQGFQRGQ
jgi:hypothetical protein